MAEPVRARRLTDQEGQRLAQIVRRGKHGPVRVRRAMITMASASGTPAPAIARLVAADEDTVRDVIRLFNERGLAALDPQWAGGRPRGTGRRLKPGSEPSNVGLVDGERVLAEASEAYRAVLGERLLAAYALGSLAHGGFSELVSDVDLGLILSDPLQRADREMIQAVADAEKSKGSPLHRRLSVFWGTPATLGGGHDGGRFPALDRLDLIENGRLLLGRDDARRGLPVPALRELLVTGAEFALDYLAGLPRPGEKPGAGLGSMQPAAENAVEEIRSPDVLLRRGIRRTTKLVLFPVRFLYTAATGGVGTNHAAAARYLEDGQAPGAELVAAAVAWRTAPPHDQVLASQLLREHLLPLYLYYIDDHIKRLVSVGETRLAAGFREWRVRLTRPPGGAP